MDITILKNMRTLKKLFLTFSILYTAVTVSCSPSISSLDNALLWKISGNGLKKPSYMLGTCHIVGGSFLDSISQFWDIYNSVNRILVEIDISNQKQTDIITTIAKDALLMPADTTYTMLYSKPDYAFIDSLMFHERIYKWQIMVPTFLVDILIYGPFFRSGDGFMDLTLIQKAFTDNKEIISLDETELLRQEPHKDLSTQAEILLQFCKNLQLSRKITARIKNLYCQQNLISLSQDSLIYQGIAQEELKDFHEKIADNPIYNGERNAKWLKRIPNYIKQESSLIVVGINHLIKKENGLIAALRDLGYEVTPVK